MVLFSVSPSPFCVAFFQFFKSCTSFSSPPLSLSLSFQLPKDHQRCRQRLCADSPALLAVSGKKIEFPAVLHISPSLCLSSVFFLCYHVIQYCLFICFIFLCPMSFSPPVLEEMDPSIIHLSMAVSFHLTVLFILCLSFHMLFFILSSYSLGTSFI